LGRLHSHILCGLVGRLQVNDRLAEGTKGADAPPKPKWTAALVVLLMLASTTALSQFFRSSTSVIGPELIRDLALSSEALGFANSAFFIAVFLGQIPVGMAFDRFGVRLTASPTPVCSWRPPASSSASVAPAATRPASW